MNAVDLAKTAYGSHATPIRTDRGTEYALLARITQRLKSAGSKGNSDFARLANALHDNRKMWTLFACDVASDENALPQHLRAQIFYLAEFTEHHSRKVLRGEGSVNALIEINTAVMAGISNEGQHA